MKISPKEFILERLKNVNEKIRGIKIQFGYDSTSDFYVINIRPEEIRRGSEEYMDFEEALWNDFYKEFPNEDILISEFDRRDTCDELIFRN